MPFVSVIVLNWNGAHCIGSCLDSLWTVNYPRDRIEIIVVDNASIDNSPSIIRGYHGATFIQNEENLGFCEGNNVGIRKARGDIVVLLNYDSVVPQDWLENLVHPMIEDPSVGVAGSKVCFPDGRIQAVGFTFDRYGRSHPICSGQVDSPKYGVVRDVDCVSGASVAIRNEVLHRVGFLDPFIFAYFDMPDYCERARKAGFRVVAAPSSRVYHLSAHGWRRRTFLQQFLLARNRLYFLLKHHRGGLNPILLGELMMWADKAREILSRSALFQKTGRIGGMAESKSTPSQILTAFAYFVGGTILAMVWFATIGGYKVSTSVRSAQAKTSNQTS